MLKTALLLKKTLLQQSVLGLLCGAGEQGIEQADGLVFLYKLHKGAAPKSYGLQVIAYQLKLRIAGTPSFGCCVAQLVLQCTLCQAMQVITAELHVS